MDAVPTAPMTVAASVDTQVLYPALQPADAPQGFDTVAADEIILAAAMPVWPRACSAVQGYEANLDEFAADNEKLRASAQLLLTQLTQHAQP